MAKNPIEEFQEYKAIAPTTKKERDLAILRKWKSGGNKPEDLSELRASYTPFIESSIRAWKPPEVPEAAFRDAMNNIFIEAAHKHDEDKGAFSTYFMTRAKSATRCGKE